MRKPIDKKTRNIALLELSAMLEARVSQKGEGSYASLHEMRGVISEEYHELMNALHEKNSDNIEQELMDLAVGVIFGYACMRVGALP